MKVLEKGRPQAGWSTEQQCTGKGNGNGGCGAKLLVEQPDLFRTSSSARDETDYYTTFKCVTFKCVECGVLTDLPDNLVPGHIRHALVSQAIWEAHRSSEQHGA